MQKFIHFTVYTKRNEHYQAARSRLHACFWSRCWSTQRGSPEFEGTTRLSPPSRSWCGCQMQQLYTLSGCKQQTHTHVSVKSVNLMCGLLTASVYTVWTTRRAVKQTTFSAKQVLCCKASLQCCTAHVLSTMSYGDSLVRVLSLYEHVLLSSGHHLFVWKPRVKIITTVLSCCVRQLRTMIR